MTPKKKYFRTAYWDCGEGHRHRTKEVAQECIAKKQAKAALLAEAVDKTEVISLYSKGHTMRDIAEIVDRSPARIGQIIAKEQRRIRAEQRQAMEEALRLERQARLEALRTEAHGWRLDGDGGLGGMPFVVTVYTPASAGRQAYGQAVIKGSEVPNRDILAHAVALARRRAWAIKRERSAVVAPSAPE